MCFKCDTNMTQEQWDHWAKKIMSNARYGMEASDYRSIFPRPKGRFTALNLMVQNTKSKRLMALYERLG